MLDEGLKRKTPIGDVLCCNLAMKVNKNLSLEAFEVAFLLFCEQFKTKAANIKPLRMLRDKLFHFFGVDPAFELVFAVSHASQGLDGYAGRQDRNKFLVQTAHVNWQSDYVGQPLSNEVDANVYKMSYSQKL